MILSGRKEVLTRLLITTLIWVSVVAVPARATGASPVNEIPDHFDQKTDSFDYTRRDVMIPMRDGVKLHTVILIPQRRARTRRSC